MSKYVISTGVLRREPGTVSAVINLVNLGYRSQNVEVEVWDWSSYSNPVKLPVLIGDNVPVVFPYRLSSENLAVMYADLTGILFYEIRITLPRDNNIIVNSFGRNAALVAQEGNTVLDRQFVIVESNKC